MNAALLTVPEIGAGYTQSPPSKPSKDSPSPCGGLTPDQLFPNRLRTSLNAAKGKNTIKESLELYSDATTMTKAFAVEASQFDCARAKGSIFGIAVTVGQAQDVTATVGGSSATAWVVTGKRFHFSAIAVQVNSVVVAYTVFTVDGPDPSTALDLTSLAKKGTDKVIAAGLS